RHDACLAVYWGLVDALPTMTASIVDQLCATSGQLANLTTLVEDPEAVRANQLFARAMMAFGHGWLQESARDARSALERDPYHFGAYYLLGRVLAQQGEIEAAAVAF